MREGRRPHPLWELTRARVVEFLREPEALFWTFGFPILLALALGIAFRTKPVERIPVAVVGPPAEVEQVVGILNQGLRFIAQSAPAGEAEAALRRGRVDLVIEVPQGFLEDATTPTDPALGNGPTYRFDPSRSEGAAARFAAHETLRQAARPSNWYGGTDLPSTAQGSRYIDFLIPGLVGLNLMGSGMWGIGFAVVHARMRKLLKRFAATPMRRGDYLLSFMLSRLVLLIGEVGVVIAFGWLLFDVVVRGSLFAVALISLIGAFAFAGLGLLVAARPRTIEGVSGWMNFVMLPMWLGSGTFFSYERFPTAVRPFIKALPLTALNDALRLVINEGAGLASCAGEIGILLAWAVVAFVVALRVFRWQ